jgi:hypothetical protein
MDAEDTVDPNGPPWLYLLTPLQQAWRETQILEGRDPDAYIEMQLVDAGKWPPECSESADDAHRT